MKISANRLRWNRITVLTFLIFIIPSANLFPYQPGKWSHTDELVQGTASALPKELHVFSPEGKLIQKAVFEYNSDRRLRKEKYFDAAGEYTGVTEYSYNKEKRIETETLYDKAGKALGRRVYRYKGNWLYAVDYFDEAGNKSITQRYRHDGRMLIGGEEISGENADRFSLIYNDKQLSAVQVFGPDKGILSEVVYTYNSSGQLLERIRKQGTNQSLCRYEYSGVNLKSFTYFTQVNGKWSLDKKLVLIY